MNVFHFSFLLFYMTLTLTLNSLHKTNYVLVSLSLFSLSVLTDFDSIFTFYLHVDDGTNKVIAIAFSLI